MNLEENSLAVATDSAADVLVPGQSGVRSHILEDLRALRGGVVHLAAVDAVVVGDLLESKQAGTDEHSLVLFSSGFFHTF
jgi:hypothetical protein